MREIKLNRGEEVTIVDTKGRKYILRALHIGGFQMYRKNFPYTLFWGTINGVVKGASACIGFVKDIRNPDTIPTLEI